MLVLAVAGGVIWGHRTQSSAAVLPKAAPAANPAAPAPSVHSTTSLPDWRAIVQELDALRVRAFTRVDAALLAHIYVAGSRALDADTAQLRDLVGRHLHPVGFAITTMRVQPVVELASEVTLRVTDRVSAYTLVGLDGGVVRVAPTAARTFAMVLQRGPVGWRILDIRR
jgi:hypothetical protein